MLLRARVVLRATSFRGGESFPPPATSEHETALHCKPKSQRMTRRLHFGGRRPQMRYSHGFAAGTLICLFVAPSSSYGRELLDEVREANRAAIQAIHTFSCKVRITYPSDPDQPGEAGEYWRSSEMVRVRGKIGDTDFDAVQRRHSKDTRNSNRRAWRGARGGAVTARGGGHCRDATCGNLDYSFFTPTRTT